MTSEDYSGFDHLACDLRANGVLEITLNRPEVLNAWNSAMVDDLAGIWRRIDLDRRVRVVLITGAGKAFSVGGDIDLMEELMVDTELTAAECIKKYAEFIRGMVDLEKPIIAAINGHVIGGGVGLALMCDVTLMSDKARILCGGQLNINVVPAEAPYLWPLLCSLAKAKYHLLCSDFIDAQEAERIGLVSAVIPHDELLDHARRLADRLAGRDPTAMGWTKRAMNHWLRIGAPILDFSLAMEAIGFLRPEAKTGVAAMRKTIGAG